MDCMWVWQTGTVQDEATVLAGTDRDLEGCAGSRWDWLRRCFRHDKPEMSIDLCAEMFGAAGFPQRDLERLGQEV